MMLIYNIQLYTYISRIYVYIIYIHVHVRTHNILYAKHTHGPHDIWGPIDQWSLWTNVRHPWKWHGLFTVSPTPIWDSVFQLVMIHDRVYHSMSWLFGRLSSVIMLSKKVSILVLNKRLGAVPGADCDQWTTPSEKVNLWGLCLLLHPLVDENGRPICIGFYGPIILTQ